MPTYTFINLETKEELPDEIMSIADMEKWLVDHPGWDVKPAAYFVGDSVRQNPKGRNKPSEGFRDVLRHIKKKYRGGSRIDATKGINTF